MIPPFRTTQCSYFICTYVHRVNLYERIDVPALCGDFLARLSTASCTSWVIMAGVELGVSEKGNNYLSRVVQVNYT